MMAGPTTNSSTALFVLGKALARQRAISVSTKLEVPG